MSKRPSSPRSTRRADSPSRSAAAVYGLLSSVVRRAPRDLSLTSLATLSTLERTGPRRITDLAVIEGVTQPSMTVLVTAMERSGLVKREGDPTDKRVALVALTPDGLDYLRDRRHAGNEAFAQLIEKLPADEAAALSAAIPALQHLRDLDNEEREPAGRASNPRRASDDIPSCLPGKPSRPVDSTRAQSATPTPLMDEHRPPAPTRFEVGDRVAAVAGIGMIRPRVSLNHERHTARAASSDAPSTVSVTSMFPLVAFE